MGSFSIWHWLIVLVVVALIFGTGKLKHMGKDLGCAIRGFKDGMNSSEIDAPQTTEGQISANKSQPDPQARS